jgi:hypothetical protein
MLLRVLCVDWRLPAVWDGADPAAKKLPIIGNIAVQKDASLP